VALNAVYRFSAKEADTCVAVGLERNAQNKRAKTTNMNYSNRNDDDISIQGVFGEWAFRRMFGLPTIDILDTRCRNAANDTFDATLSNGWAVDVKTTLFEVESILVGEHKRRNPAGAYALMILTYVDGSPYRHSRRAEHGGPAPEELAYDPIQARFAGIINSAAVLIQPNIQRSRYGGMFYAYPVDKLLAWPEASTVAAPVMTSFF